MANGLTTKQVKCLKELVIAEEGGIEQTQTNRFLFEKLVQMGLAFRNMRTKHVKTRGKSRGTHAKLIPIVFYAPSPEGHRRVSEEEEQSA